LAKEPAHSTRPQIQQHCVPRYLPDGAKEKDCFAGWPARYRTSSQKPRSPLATNSEIPAYKHRSDSRNGLLFRPAFANSAGCLESPCGTDALPEEYDGDAYEVGSRLRLPPARPARTNS